MLFPCPEGSVVGKSFQSEVEVRLKAKSRCEMRPEVSPEAAKIVSFLKVPAATFGGANCTPKLQNLLFL